MAGDKSLRCSLDPWNSGLPSPRSSPQARTLESLKEGAMLHPYRNVLKSVHVNGRMQTISRAGDPLVQRTASLTAAILERADRWHTEQVLKDPRPDDRESRIKSRDDRVSS